MPLVVDCWNTVVVIRTWEEEVRSVTVCAGHFSRNGRTEAAYLGCAFSFLCIEEDTNHPEIL